MTKDYIVMVLNLKIHIAYSKRIRRVLYFQALC